MYLDLFEREIAFSHHNRTCFSSLCFSSLVYDFRLTEQTSQIKHSACSGLVILMTVTPSCVLYTASVTFDPSIGIITKSLLISSCTCIQFDLSENVSKRRLLLIFYELHASTFKEFQKPKLISLYFILVCLFFIYLHL